VLTLWCVVTVLAGLFLVGTPLRWLLHGGRPLGREEWLEVPAVAVAGIVLLLHTLVYCDLPISRCVAWVWVGVAVLWGLMAWRRQVLSSLSSYPLTVFAAGVVVFCVQGLGLFVMGAEWYSGRGHSDQYNYTAVAQFLTDVPFSTTYAQIGHHPYLIDAIKLKYDRIGVMLLQGWFSAVARQDARTLFEPTILLSPTLVVLVVYALGRRLGLRHWPALLAATGAGMLPGLALVHLESFLAHAVSIPLLLSCALALCDLAREPGWRRLLLAGMLVAATTAIYTEITLVLVGLIVLILGGAVLLRVVRPLAGVGCLLAVPALALLLNPLYLPMLYHVCQRSVISTSVKGFADLYPWAYQLQGLGCLWTCDFWAAGDGWPAQLLAWGALVLTAIAGAGWLRAWGRHLLALPGCWRSAGYRNSLLLVSSVLVVAFLPLLVLCKGRDCPYQFYKLLLSVSPLLVLGVALCVTPVRLPIPTEVVPGPTPWTRRQGLIAVLPLVLVLAVTTAGTAAMAQASTRWSEVGGWRGAGQSIACSPYWCGMARVLKAAPKLNLVLAAGSGVFKNCWPAYFARRHEVWLTNPDINDANRVDVDYPQAAHVLDLSTLPEDAHLLTSCWTVMCPQVAGDAQIVWGNCVFLVWKLGRGPFAIRTHAEDQTEISYDAVPSTVTLGMGPKPVRMHFWTNRAGELQLSGRFRVGGTAAGGGSVRLRFSNGQGQSRSVEWQAGKHTVTLPLPAGKSVVTVECLAGAGAPPAAELVRVEMLALRFTDLPTESSVPVDHR
jgi:hypothetical protein